MISKEDLLRKYNMTEAMFENADIAWDELEMIYNDFQAKIPHYQDILSKFEKEFLGNTKRAGIHSYRTRIKDPEHLIVKIIRKKSENYKKYQKLTKDNYEKFLTDLIGIRGFILFKEQWIDFHKYIEECFENNAVYYIKDSLTDFDEDINHHYMAEAPKVHIRNGDNRKIYEAHIAPDKIQSNKIYRSIHYILKYNGVYIEIQIRTLYEEGWGEINHYIVYPYYENNENLRQYTELLNRLSGLADEMGSFFCVLKKLELEILEQIKVQANDVNEKRQVDAGNPKVSTESLIGSGVEMTTEKENSTAWDCLLEVVRE